jgi:DNA repair exonuclease SbcCD ATPase subunit
MPISLRDALNRKIGRRDQLIEDRDRTKKALLELESSLQNIEKAQSIIQTVAKQTQEQLKFHIESIVTMALEAVLPEPYQFQVDFEIRRNKTEADLYFVRDGEKIKPMDAAGGGAVDLASFALRVTLWSLGKTRSTIVLDEPMKFVSRDLQTKAGYMMHELSEKLGLQFIVVSHDPNIIEGADRIFQVQMKDGRSKLTVEN